MTDTAPRYVVLVWFHDHWGVTYETDDAREAELVTRQAAEKVKAITVDTERAEEPLTTAEVSREEALVRSLQEQTNYSSAVLDECHRLLTAVKRVDQKYGPYPDFARWREANQPRAGSETSRGDA